MAKGIRALLDTVMQALPQVGNLGLLFFLLFFIFAALGVELFGRLECTEDLPCEGLGEHAHFKDFGMAFLTLFRVATGDNWNGIMKDTLRENCDYSSDCVRNCCVSAIVAPLYFVVFVLMAQFVLVNVVVAVLMKHLEESHKQMDDDIEMDAELERELAAEVRGEQLAAARAAEEMKLNRSGQTKPTTHRPLVKMASLPPNFVFPFNNVEERSFRRASLNILNSGGRLSASDFSMPLAPNINIRQASPDEADSKVSVANLSPVPLRSPLADPPDADWACVFASLGDPCHVQLLGDGRLLLDVGRRRSTDAPRHHARSPDRRLSAGERRWLRADGPEASAGNVRRWLSAEDEAKSAAEGGSRDYNRSAEGGPKRWLSAEPDNVDVVGSGNGNSSRSAEAGHRRCHSAEPDNVDVFGSAGGGRRDSNRSAETGHRRWLSAQPNNVDVVGSGNEKSSTSAETGHRRWLSVEPDNVLIVRRADGDCRDSRRRNSEAGQRNASVRLSAESDNTDVRKSADKGNKQGTESEIRDVKRTVEAGQNARRWLSAEPDHRDSIKSPEGRSADVDGELSSEIDRSAEGVKRSSAESGVTKWLKVEPHSRDFTRSLSAEGGNRDIDRKPSAEVTVSKWLGVEPDVSKSSEVDHRDINVTLSAEKDGQTSWLSVEPDVRDLNRRWSAEVDNRKSNAEFDHRDNFLKLSVEEGNREVHRRLSAETGAHESTETSSAIRKVDSDLDDKKVSKADQAGSVSTRTLPRTSSNSGCSNEQRPPHPERVASSDSGDCFHNDDSPLIKPHLRRRLGSSSLSYNEGTDSTDC